MARWRAATNPSPLYIRGLKIVVPVMSRTTNHKNTLIILQGILLGNRTGAAQTYMLILWNNKNQLVPSTAEW